MNDDFEVRVADWLHDRARPDPAALATIVASIDALPPRRVARHRTWLLAAAAVIAIVAIGGTSLLVATRPEGSPPVGSSRPVPPDPAAFAGDPRLAACFGTIGPVEYAFEMAHARDYQRHLPVMLLAPELDVDDPGFVVVFAVGAQIPGAGGPATSSPGSNLRTVCVLADGVPNLYEQVDVSGIQPILRAEASASPAEPSSSPGPGIGSPTPEPTRNLRFVPITSLALGADGRHIDLAFVGAHEYIPGDPCSIRYDVMTAVVNDVLEVGVFPKAEVQSDPRPTSVSCADLGFSRTLQVVLAEPFAGATWRDLAGYLHFLAPPKGLVELTGLPSGWVLQKARDVEDSPAGRWERTYSSDASLVDPTDTVVFYQSFDGSVPVTGGEEVTQVRVDGRAATLYRHAPTGELVLVWQVGGNGLGLVAFEQRFPPDALIALAESAQAPEP